MREYPNTVMSAPEAYNVLDIVIPASVVMAYLLSKLLELYVEFVFDHCGRIPLVGPKWGVIKHSIGAIP
jgi:hypothetical protein